MKRILKAFSFVLGACLLTVLAAGGYFYFSAVRPLQSGIGMFAGGGNEALSPEPVHFTLAGEDFWIPKYYLLLPIEKEREPSLIDVYVNWPEMNPQIEERKDPRLAQKKIKQLVMVILNDKSRTPLRKPTVLETWQLSNDRSYGGPFVETGEMKYGLIQYQTSFPDKTRLYAEMYEEREDGKLKSFILCSDDYAKRNPTCESHQETEKFIIRVSFNKIYLSEWREIQRKGNALIESFKSKPATKD